MNKSIFLEQKDKISNLKSSILVNKILLQDLYLHNNRTVNNFRLFMIYNIEILRCMYKDIVYAKVKTFIDK